MKKQVHAFVLAVIQHKGKYLLTQRNELDPEDPKDFLNAWQLPGGGINFKEKTEDAVKREVLEEVGIEVSIIRPLPYVIDSIRPHWHGVGLVYLCKPKKRKFIVKINHESKKFGWYSLKEILRLKKQLPGNKEAILSAPGALSFEHFLPWIHTIMLAYQAQNILEFDPFKPKNAMFSRAYYTKKVN